MKKFIVAGVGFNFNGGTGSIAYNPHPNVGLVADFGAYHTGSNGVNATLVTYMFGPKFAIRSDDRVTPYVHALFGGAHVGASLGGASGSSNGFAMALGGGLDAKVNDNVAIRVAQVDYLMTRFSGSNDHNVRISTGLVFRWGK